MSGLVCRLGHIEGWEQEYEYAKKILPDNTYDVSQCTIYITGNSNKKGIYLQSNYITDGFTNPTKIYTDEIFDLLVLTLHIIFAEKNIAQEQIDQAVYSHLFEIKYKIDKEVMEKFKLDLSGAQNVEFLPAR